MQITITTAILTIVNFFIMMAVLKHFFYEPIVNMLDERKKNIATDLKEAEQAKDDARKMKEDYEASIQNAREEAQEILAEARKIGENTRAEIVEEAKEEAMRVSDRAKAEIARERDNALASLRKDVAKLAISAAEQVIERDVTEADHNRMVDAFIQEVGNQDD